MLRQVRPLSVLAHTFSPLAASARTTLWLSPCSVVRCCRRLPHTHSPSRLPIHNLPLPSTMSVVTLTLPRLLSASSLMKLPREQS